MPSELAMELGERALIADGQPPASAARRPHPAARDRGEHDGYFEPVRETPGLADAFHRLVRELRGAGYDDDSLAAAIDGACEVPEKATALSEIFAEFLGAGATSTGPTTACWPPRPTERPGERSSSSASGRRPPALIGTARSTSREHLPVTVLLPATGVEEVDSAHAELRAALLAAGADRPSRSTSDEPRSNRPARSARRHLFRDSRRNPRTADDSLRLISGPDPAREVREVARQCLAWAREGIRFHEMAIAYRHPDPYRSLIESVFIEAGVPSTCTRERRCPSARSAAG